MFFFVPNYVCTVNVDQLSVNYPPDSPSSIKAIVSECNKKTVENFYRGGSLPSKFVCHQYTAKNVLFLQFLLLLVPQLSITLLSSDWKFLENFDKAYPQGEEFPTPALLKSATN